MEGEVCLVSLLVYERGSTGRYLEWGASLKREAGKTLHVLLCN